MSLLSLRAESNRVHLVDGGVLAPIEGLFRDSSSNASLLEPICSLVASLCDSSHAKVITACAKSELPLLLIRAMSSDEQASRHSLAAGLHAWARLLQAHRVSLLSHAGQHLVPLLGPMMRRHQDDFELQRWCCVIWQQLWAEKRGQNDALFSTALPLILQAMKQHRVVEHVQKAATEAILTRMTVEGAGQWHATAASSYRSIAC